MDDEECFLNQAVCRRLQLGASTPQLYEWVGLIQCVVRFRFHIDYQRFLFEVSECVRSIPLHDAVVVANALLPLIDEAATELATFKSCADESIERLTTCPTCPTVRLTATDGVLRQFEEHAQLS